MNYIKLNANMYRSFATQYSTTRIETTISEGGQLGIDCERAKSCRECIYRYRSTCPGTTAKGHCAVKKVMLAD